MSILHRIMELDAKVFMTKDRYKLGNTISSKVLAFLPYCISAIFRPSKVWCVKCGGKVRSVSATTS